MIPTEYFFLPHQQQKTQLRDRDMSLSVSLAPDPDQTILEEYLRLLRDGKSKGPQRTRPCVFVSVVSRAVEFGDPADPVI